MSEEPNLPPIPSIGDVLTRKKGYIEYKYTVLLCTSCNAKTERLFKEGDYVFKKIEDKPCQKCSNVEFTITEIYAEYKKEGKKNKKIK
ncbi:MAG: hypothetical protein ACTSRZ_13665 [Promethearchaeota archaeon]